MRRLDRVALFGVLVVSSCGQSLDSPAAPAPDVTTTTEVELTPTTPPTVATTQQPDAPTAQPDVTPETVAQPPPPVTVPATPPILRRGDEGPWVVKLQEDLRRHGYPIEPDGMFGPSTEAAVRGSQTAHGLEIDGLCGPNTWATLAHGEILPVVDAAAPLYLRADGLGTFDFGSDATPIIARLTAELGLPTSDRTERWGDAACYEQPCETGQRKMRWHKIDQYKFSVRFVATTDGVAFVGWELVSRGDETSYGCTTQAGIGLGSTTAQVVAAYPNAHFGLWRRDQVSCRGEWWTPSEFWIGEPADTHGTNGLRGFTTYHTFNQAEAVGAALDALGIPRTRPCNSLWDCHDAFAETQELLGVPTSGVMDPETWAALGFQLPPDTSATVNWLEAGEPDQVHC